MKVLRRKAKVVCIMMVSIMAAITIPCQSVSAALISTEIVADSARGQAARDQLQHFIAREDVQAALLTQGIDPLEAKARIDALSDNEVIRMADQLDELPAGGSALLLVGAAILVATIIVYAVILLAVEATE